MIQQLLPDVCFKEMKTYNQKYYNYNISLYIKYKLYLFAYSTIDLCILFYHENHWSINYCNNDLH